MNRALILLLTLLTLSVTGLAGEPRTVDYQYDAAGRLVRMIVFAPTGIEVTDYNYDAAGNLLETVEGPLPELIFGNGFEDP